MSKLVNDLIHNGYLRTDNVINAFSKVHRIEFIPDDLAGYAEKDIALPIGYGQTISQPLIVAVMLEMLDVREGFHVLDVGSGSGWTSALLADMVGEKGRVTSLEIIKDLCEKAKKNSDKYGFVRKGIIEFNCLSAINGFEKNAPYDRILVSASSDEIPEPFKQQLKVGGKMVLPIADSIWYVEKRTQDDYYIEKFPGFSFVPFIKD